jgi:enamine deaminase RidA (YjgF/YER057c/UK114 family)
VSPKPPDPRIVNPAGLAAPRGFSHGVMAPEGARILYVAGQIGVAAGETRDARDAGGAPRAAHFVSQFDRALAAVLAVVREAGGAPEHVVRMTVFVTDIAAYRGSLGELGTLWRARMGTHYPAMSLVAVNALVEPAALVEIEATAAIPVAAS